MGEDLTPTARQKLNKWVFQKMEAHNLSMSELGRRANIDQSAISKVLGGKRNGGFGFYLSIARVFDAVPEFFRVAEVLPDPDD